MKYFGILLIVMCALFVASLAHSYFLKYTLYRWIINSIIYPYWAHKIRRMNYYQQLALVTDWIVYPKWFLNYWFGRALKSYLLRQLEKNLPNNIDKFN